VEEGWGSVGSNNYFHKILTECGNGKFHAWKNTYSRAPVCSQGEQRGKETRNEGFCNQGQWFVLWAELIEGAVVGGAKNSGVTPGGVKGMSSSISSGRGRSPGEERSLTEGANSFAAVVTQEGFH